MAVTSGSSALEYEWSIDGRSQQLDDEARDWREVVPEYIADVVEGRIGQVTVGTPDPWLAFSLR